MNTQPDLELLRVFVGENQKHDGRPLYEAIVQAAHKQGLTGAMATRGMMGFWRYGPIRTSKVLRLNEDLPILIEIAGKQEQIAAFLPELKDMVKQGLVTREKVQVVINQDEEG